MSMREKFTRWYAFTRGTLSGMSFKQKVNYIFYYYWKWMLLLLVLILFGFYVGDAVAQAHREIVLQGFFTNDELNLFDAEQIEKEYAAHLGLGKKQDVIFDDDLYIDLGGEATEYTAASNGKLIAYMAVQELDFVVTSEAVLHHYEAQTPLLDFEELLPPELFEKLRPWLYVYTDAQGQTLYAALDMSHSRFMTGEAQARYEAAGETFYMFVPKLAPNRDALCEFIRWCFPDLS